MESLYFLFYMGKGVHIVYKMLSFLPNYILDSLIYVNLQLVYELRLRADCPITVNYRGVYQYLSAFGVTSHREKALICHAQDIENCVYRAGKYSVYSVEEQIKQGFISATGGVRIGLAGEYVFNGEKPLAMRNFTALCIRIPHEVVGCGEEIFQKCMSDTVKNLLIVSPPGMGKTTVLRDLGRLIGFKTRKNVLICDERGEISCGFVGETCDVIKYADKRTAFTAGIRALRPEVIITDELSEEDCWAVGKAINAGVATIASAHFFDFAQIQPVFLKLFEYFVILDPDVVGRVKGIYDKNGVEL